MRGLMTEDAKSVDEMGFEEALDELERIVEELESGQVELDRMVDRFERAMGLRKRCAHLLAEAETKIEQLVDEEGSTEPFSPGDTNDDQS